MFFNVKYDDWQVIGIIVSTFVSTIAFVWTLYESRKNSRESKGMIQESTRPIIAIYSDRNHNTNMYYYLIIKNYGKSLAEIKTVFSNYSFADNKAYFPDSRIDFLSDLQGSFIAPGQSKLIAIDYGKTKDVEIKIEIVYASKYRTYTESVEANFTRGLHSSIMFPASKDKELKQISDSLHEMNTRNLF